MLDETDSMKILRQICKNMSATEVLKRLEVRLWDEPLGRDSFKKLIHRLDPTLGEDLLLRAFSKLRNQEGRVEVQVLVRNLVGRFEETIDGKIAAFKVIYDEVI